MSKLRTLFGRVTGPSARLKELDEVKDVIAELAKIEIHLEDYGITVTEVQQRPLAPGFDFFCEQSSRLLIAARKSLGVHDQPKKLESLRPCLKSDGGYRYDPKLWEGTKIGGARSGLAEDNVHTPMGKFVSANSKGKSFRQIGKGRALHLIIALNGRCNAHLDSHGFVVGHDGHQSIVDFNAMAEHGLFDLGPDFLPGAYVTWGKHGFMVPVVKPEKDPDGRTKVFVGFFGQF